MKTTSKSIALAAVTMADPRWAAVLARDPAADGGFLYSVRTTGVYCRPSCAARRARPEHVAFHLTAADAERADFREGVRLTFTMRVPPVASSPRATTARPTAIRRRALARRSGEESRAGGT